MPSKKLSLPREGVAGIAAAAPVAAQAPARAAVAMTLRNLIHSALLLIASWAGVAAFYLWAGAEFVAFAQVLVQQESTAEMAWLARAAARALLRDAGASPGCLDSQLIDRVVERTDDAAFRTDVLGDYSIVESERADMVAGPEPTAYGELADFVNAARER